MEMDDRAKSFTTSVASKDDAQSLLYGVRSKRHLPPRFFTKSRRRSTWARFLQQASMFIVFGLPCLIGIWLPWFLTAMYSNYYSTYNNPYGNCGDSILSPDAFLPYYLSFSAAKAIDLTWNIVVGRGLQATLAYLLYRVATQSLLRLTEFRGVSFDYFTTVAFYPSNLASLPTLLFGTLRNKGWRAKMTTFWLFISAAIVLVIPSFLDAMTGYVQPQIITTKMPDGSFVSSSGIKFNNTATTPYRNDNGTIWYITVDYYENNMMCTPSGNNT